MERKEISLFDPKFIRTKGDDSLIGKKMFFDDNLDDLKLTVDGQSEGQGVYRTLLGITDCSFMDDSGRHWNYAYYDPLYEIKAAYSQGRQIQQRWRSSSPWEDIIANPSWSSDIEYRIKPEETWRPYKGFDEFLADVQERFPSTRNRPAGTMPLVWVRLQQNQHAFHLITGYNTDCGAGTAFVAGSDIFTCSMMFYTFTYTDGTPFGKKE